MRKTTKQKIHFIVMKIGNYMIVASTADILYTRIIASEMFDLERNSS
ncbi:hypothetical protein HT594_00015 [Phenacoccus solenopsis nudivirus]|nr:hypothetical protein HT594_00015 [Phenacoccus solenopsis nudivirus]